MLKMIFPWRITLLVSALLTSLIQAKLFKYMDNCAGKEDMLNDHIYECNMLIDAAKHAIDTVAHNIVAQKLITSYFKIQFVTVDGRAVVRHADWSEWALVKSTPLFLMYIDLVNTFLKTGSYPDKRGTPQVFCDDDFVQSFPWDSAAVDKHGNYIRNTLTGGYWTIKQIYATFPDMVSMVPYFATSLNAYYFDAPNSASCHPGSLAETMVGIPTGHASISPVQWTSTIESEIMVICPAAVDGTHNFLERLGETGWADPASYTMLDELIPESGTMYHELFHLVSGRIGWKRSLDPRKYVPRMVNDHAASLQGCLNLDRDRAVNNAESYLLFSLAYWYYYHDWNNGRKRVTFYPGFAVYWDWLEWSM